MVNTGSQSEHVGEVETAILDAERFRQIVEITNGSFQFEKSAHEFPIVIQALSNTNLLLDTLLQLDEEKQ